MSQSDDSYYEESTFTKLFQGVGSIGALFITSTYSARDLVLLKQKQIQAVLSAEKQQKINLPKKQIPAYLYLQIEDNIDFNIAQYFQESFKFIEENRRLTNILIHCSKGTNCSVTLVIAYLVKKYQYTYQQALTLVIRRYPNFNVTEFNPGFVHRLQYFAVQKGDFNLVKDNCFRKRIERVRRTFDGIVRTYSKELTTEQKLMGCQSPSKYVGRSSRSLLSFKSDNSQMFLPYQSIRKINHSNPELETQPSSQLSREYSKFLPKKSQEEIQDEEHHRKVVSEIFLLSQQSKLYQSKRIESVNSDVSAMKNYDRLKKGKKHHLTFYSPLEKYQKYEMFTQSKLNIEFEAFNNIKM